MRKEIDCIFVVPDFYDENLKHKFSNTEMLGPEYIIASLEKVGYKTEFFNMYSHSINGQKAIRKKSIGDVSTASSMVQSIVINHRALKKRNFTRQYVGH